MNFSFGSWTALALCVLLHQVVAENFLALNSVYGLLGNTISAAAVDLPVGTCNADTPPAVSADTLQQSVAKAAVQIVMQKQSAASTANPGNRSVRLVSVVPSSVECQAGFGGCGPVKRPSCSKDGGSISKRNIGYYESWANTRACNAVTPEDLNLDGLTHINFAFVFFDPVNFQIIPMDKNAGTLLSRFTKLKEKKAGLQTWVSVGGWSFNDPGPYQKAFSTMASTAGNRKMFIDGLIKFMETYSFTGMDMDWEYPAAEDRGGMPEDTANFVLLCKDIKQAFGTKFGYSITLPASYWYLQHFDLAGMQPYVDWFNMMTYDMHGVWDAASKFVGAYVAPHTNITEIDLGLDLLWRSGLKPEKVVIGQGYYGRSFTLSDPTCNKPNGICKFSGGANEGPCSKASGILTLQEIFDIIKQKNLTPIKDEKAGVKWIHWDNDQWVSYDDSETLVMKKAFANSRCLGGSMIWALDQVDQKANSLQYPEDWSEEQISISEDLIADEEVKGVCYTTKCGDTCRKGDHEASQMNGQPGSMSTMDRCSKGEYRRLCCSKGTTMGICRWRGYRGLGLACTGGCGDFETEVTQNTNHHSDKEDQTCSGGSQSYCCAGFTPPISKEQIEDRIKDEAADAAIALAEALALEVAARVFCRIAITAALTPLTFIPIVGWIIRLAVQAAVPALANLCAKGIAKAGKSVFKFKGKDYDVKLDKPLQPKNDRGNRDKKDDAPEKDGHCDIKDVGLVKRAVLRDSKQTTTHTRIARKTITKVCDGGKNPQACLHYQSVVTNQNLERMTCTSKQVVGADPRPLVDAYNDQHNTDWINGWMQKPGLNCQRDEFPPAVVWRGRDNRQWIRLIPGDQNGSAGQLFRGVCPPNYKLGPLQGFRELKSLKGCRRVVRRFAVTRTATTNVLRMKFINMPNVVDDGIPENPCYPKTLVPDPGFALLANDPWYQRNAGNKQYTAGYRKAPLPRIIAGKVNRPGYSKRSSDDNDFDPDGIKVDEGNSTRKATDQELFEGLGFLRCENGDCRGELEELGIESAPFDGPDPTAPPAALAYATAVDALPTSLSKVLDTATFVHEEIRALITPAPMLEPAFEECGFDE
ncbi:uncharacterized protein RCO7_00033 [Rhynchosporium graminicola]|uniref:chitinase n=1 Tax=Rhynchosporium graminicola TaxID=2792576 RepID=A0A1E1KLW0_9HELO|nr:uncharacterized protein RCO7_00033 [Rhynchosporium commune]